MVVYAWFAIDIVAGVWEVLRMPFDNGKGRPSFVFPIAETGFWVWCITQPRVRNEVEAKKTRIVNLLAGFWISSVVLVMPVNAAWVAAQRMDSRIVYFIVELCLER